MHDECELRGLVDAAPEYKSPPVAESTSEDIFYYRGNPISLAVARKIQVDHPTLVYVAGDFWEFNGQIYTQIPPQRIGAVIIDLIGDRVSRNKIGDIQHLLGIETFQSPDFFHQQDSWFIMVQNGALDVRTLKLHPHAPQYRARHLLPVMYDPDADCPRFKRCLTEWLPDDAGARDLLVEWLGYCLVPDTRQEKALILIGEGANGKGRFIHVQEELLGKKNFSGLSLSSLLSDRTFMTAGLDGKLLNICPESELATDLDEGWLKSLISGDPVEVERKGRDPFTMRPFARFVIQSNNPPRLKDTSNGIWRRLAVVRFTRIFTEAEQDRNLDTKLAEELSGIFNLGLEGLRRLNERGRFDLTPNMIEDRKSYQHECNPLMAWKDEYLITEDPGLDHRAVWTKCSDAYQHYENWCRDNGYQVLGRNNFTKELKRLGVKQGTPNDSVGRTVRAFMGVELRYN